MIADEYYVQSFKEIENGVFVSDRIEIQEGTKNVIMVCSEIESKEIIGSPFYLFRYMPFSRLYTELEKKTLTFVSPLKWKDPFEKAFLELNNGLNVKCICSTYNRSIGEEWAWQAYSCDEPIIRIGLQFDKFLSVLSNITKKKGNKWKFYISVCDYSLNKEDILSLKASVKKNKTLLSNDEFLSLMSIKRKAFATEKEIRVFAITDGNNSEPITVFKKVDYKNFLSSILLEPLTPYDDETRQKQHSKLQEIMNNGIRRYLEKEKGVDKKMIQQSHVYEMK